MKERQQIRGTMTSAWEQVRARVEQVRAKAESDPEAAAGWRLDLLADVVYTIGRGDCPYPVSLAKEAAKVLDIELNWEPS